MNKKGQSVLSEHAMIFFIVVAAIVAMTTYVQRTFEARIHDTRNFMINAVVNPSVCDANCMAATGGGIYYEYEPYYSRVLTDTTRNGAETRTATNGSANAIGAIYVNSINESTKMITTSAQLPAECADGTGPKPGYCAGL